MRTVYPSIYLYCLQFLSSTVLIFSEYRSFTSLVKCILRYFILFDAITVVDGIVFLISLSGSLLLVYNSATDFYILKSCIRQSYWIYSLVLIVFGSFRGFFCIVSCHLQIVTVLFLAFQFGRLLFLFLIRLLWLGLPILCWIKVMIWAPLSRCWS